MAVDIFISYAFEDLPYLQKLETHLAALKRQGIVQTWHAERVVPGEDWNAALKRYLENARVILLLVSAGYVHSDMAYAQMESAIRRSRQGKACVIPILVRPCFRQGLAMEGLFRLPVDGKSISEWQNEDTAWTNVTHGIHRAIVELKRGETASPMSIPPSEKPTYSGGSPSSVPTHTHLTAHITIGPRSAASPVQSGLVPPVAAPPSSRPSGIGIFQYRTLAIGASTLALLITLVVVLWNGKDETASEALYAANEPMFAPTHSPPAEPAAKLPMDQISPRAAEPSRSPLGGFAQPERAWVEAYGAAIASGDVDRILSLHVLPTPYFFAARDQSEAQLRKRYEGWYKGDGRTHRTGFESCSLVKIANDGSRALRCTTYVEPPFKSSPSRVPTCLVFTKEGKLLARTEIAASSSCPPFE